MFARSDETLYQRWIEGDLAAFDAIYARYERPLFGFLRRQLDDATEAEDVLHETFLALVKERGRGEAAQSFRAWLFQVARNLVFNRVRSRTRSSRAQDSVAVLELVKGPLESADELLSNRQTADAVRAAVTKLAPAQSELFHLRAQGLSYDELAEVLGVPVGTVKSRLHELVKRLRAEVTHEL